MHTRNHSIKEIGRVLKKQRELLIIKNNNLYLAFYKNCIIIVGNRENR